MLGNRVGYPMMSSIAVIDDGEMDVYFLRGLASEQGASDLCRRCLGSFCVTSCSVRPQNRFMIRTKLLSARGG